MLTICKMCMNSKCIPTSKAPTLRDTTKPELYKINATLYRIKVNYMHVFTKINLYTNILI